MSRYWTEVLEDALGEVGITATKEQVEQMAGWVESAHENYGMAHGHECIPNPLAQELDRVRTQLKTELEKVHCQECNGVGTITTYGPYHCATSRCWKCGGQGRHSR